MSKKLFVVLMVLLIVMVLWSLGLEDKAEVKSQSANLVSLQTSETSKKAQQKYVKKSLKQAMLNHEKVILVSSQPKKEAEQDWSYLAVYRRLEWAGVCYQYYKFKKFNKDKNSANYANDLARQFEQSQSEKTMLPKVVSALNEYQQHCDQLHKEVYAYLGIEPKQIEHSNVFMVGQKLIELLAETPTKTDKEVNLKKYNDLTMKFGETYAEFETNKKQHDQLDQAQIDALYDELNQIQKETMSLGNSLDIERDLLISEQLSVRIDEINHKLANRYDTGAEDYLAAKQSLLDQLIEIQANLITNDADAFKIMKLAAEMSWETDKIGIRPYFSMLKNLDLPLWTPGEQMMTAMGVKDRNAFSHAANPATLLYLCNLGYDCSADGSLAMQLCLNHWKNLPEACDLPVDQFLIEHAVSPNLLEDVLTLYQWMEQAYGA